MGSRRRPVTRSSRDDVLPDQDSNLQLLPNVKSTKSSTRFEIGDYLGHQKWHYARTPALHPALTDFGPHSLQKFLQDELESLRLRAQSETSRREQEMRDLARSLVNSPGDVRMTKENGKNTSQASRAKVLPPPQDISTIENDKRSVRKGKKTAPRVPQPGGPKDATARRKDSQQRQSTSVPHAKIVRLTLSQMTPSNVQKSLLAEEDQDEMVNDSLNKSRDFDVDNWLRPLQDIGGNHFRPRLLDGNSRQPQMGKSFDSSMLDHNELSDLDTYASMQPRLKTASLQKSATDESTLEAVSSPRLSRTSSFENHASHSRDTLRTTKQSSGRLRQQSEDSKRRRKTPSNTSPMSLSDLAFVPSLADSMRSASQLVEEEPSDGAPGNGLPLDVDLSFKYKSPARAPHRQSSQPSDYLDIGGSAFRSSSRRMRGFGDFFPDNEHIHMADEARRSDVEMQQAIMESIKAKNTQHRTSHSLPRLHQQVVYDFKKCMPEEMPLNIRQAEINRCTIWQSHGFDDRGKRLSRQRSLENDGIFTPEQLDPCQLNILNAPNEDGDYTRSLEITQSRSNRHASRLCSPIAPKTSLPIEIWEADTGKSPGGVLQYLSPAEIRNVRLVCKSLAEDLEPHVFRNVVTKFGPSLFSLDPSYTREGKLEIDGPSSMLHRHGSEMNKFGICFDYDAIGLRQAPYKVTERAVDAWFGRYIWPVKDYPYFQSLRDIDKLLDDERRLLTQGIKQLTKCRELAISCDSGHGWLEGPDISDLAFYRERGKKGAKVFGQTYSAPDRGYEDGMKHLFKWAQLNTINENIKYLDGKSKRTREELDKLRSIIVREYDQFSNERSQPDYTQHIHTGGLAGPVPPPQPPNAGFPNLNQLHQMIAAHPALHGNPPMPGLPANMPWQIPAGQPGANLQNRRSRFQNVMNLVSRNTASSKPVSKDSSKKSEPIHPQWPLIFNGFNLAAEPRGDSNYVQSRVATPSDFPLLPNSLSESQAQWLMETSWIQRTFLSAYTDAVRVNAGALKNVHSLHIAKVSSGLLPCLSQKTFWSCLKGLRRITILVKPDWRFEHLPGDKFFQSTMSTEPINAVYKFAELLRDSIVPLENLNSLHIGYLGGGEHQAGIFGRNQHIMPAPITTNSRAWLVAQNSSMPRPDPTTMFVFPHVRTLTFENCWFSPLMLENFMTKSRDTSLHNLVLDSVSLTAQVTSTRTDGPLRTVDHHLKCQHTPSAWLNETVPPNAAWVNVLDKITPGATLLDHKYDANMINEEEQPRPDPAFRGNIQQVTLRSCGYVKILGIPSNDFNQNELVFQNAQWVAMDEGLRMRASAFTKTVPNDNVADNGDEEDRRADALASSRRRRVSSMTGQGGNPTPGTITLSQVRRQKDSRPRTTSRFIMLSGRAAHTRGESIAINDETAHTASMTGYLTQCIHPVEKRILERMWGMKFGWGNDMRRWEAVEDGWFMGGTGRFSGEIYRDAELQEAAAIPIQADEDQENAGENESSSDDSDTEIEPRSTSAFDTNSAVADPDLTDIDQDDTSWDNTNIGLGTSAGFLMPGGVLRQTRRPAAVFMGQPMTLNDDDDEDMPEMAEPE